VHTVVVRVWMPDRPGALGQVASRIGAVRGDLLGIEILEVGAGRAVDELVVALPDADLVDLMVNEVHAIDGVSVEHVRAIDVEHVDRSVLTLALAADLAESTPGTRVERLVEGVVAITDADWALCTSGDRLLVATDGAPSPEWVASLVAGSRHLDGDTMLSSDLFWVELPTAGCWVAAGRSDRPIHDRERRLLAYFARVADALLEPIGP